MKKYIAVAVLMLGATLANAEYVKASDLAYDCKVSSVNTAENSTILTAFQDGICLGFMNGFIQGFDGRLTVTDGKKYSIDLVDGISSGQMGRVFVLYMEKHPEMENQPATLPLIKALVDAGLLTKNLVPNTLTTKEQ